MKEAARQNLAPSIVRTSVLVIAGIFVLFFIDTFLSRMERSESRVEAERFYQAGQRDLKQGRNADAADQFRSAFSVARDNQAYQLALGQALAAAGRLTDAEASLSDLLERDPTGGEPNLAMARVLTKEGRVDEALSYYHRAIYGQWKQNALANRVKVRFELVDLLLERNQKQDLLAELLPLEEEAQGDSAAKLKLGRLFIAAGSPARAMDVLRDAQRAQPRNPDVYSGLAEAEFAQANYRTALGYFEVALRLRPDESVRKRMEVSEQVLALDPTQRGLTAPEQERRSRKVLDMILTSVRPCLGAATSRERELMDRSAKALKEYVAPAHRGAAYESNLDLSDKLWQAWKSDCGHSDMPIAEPLALVLNKIAPK